MKRLATGAAPSSVVAPSDLAFFAAKGDSSSALRFLDGGSGAAFVSSSSPLESESESEPEPEAASSESASESEESSESAAAWRYVRRMWNS